MNDFRSLAHRSGADSNSINRGNLPHKHTNTHNTLESEVLRELFQPVLLNSVSTTIYTMLRSALHSLDETLQYRN